MKSKLLRITGVIAIVLAIFGSGFIAGTTHFAFGQGGGQPANTQTLFGPFWEAWDIVHQNYVDPINDDTLMQGAISGMVNGLGDPHSLYFSPQEFSQVNSDLSGQFEGIGATVSKDVNTGGLKIVDMFNGSPARVGGLKTNDIIITVDGKDITMLTETQIVSKVRGAAGTSVVLGVFRTGQTKLINITIKRAVINVPDVITAVYKGNIGYIKLTQFTDKATQDVRRALVKLNANKLNGLILDLRSNPGGGFQTAVDIASDFIKSGPVVITKGKPGSTDRVSNASGKPLAPDVPLVVLTNAGSASASELVTGALHDRGRALTVGETTYGKGSAQLYIPVSNGGAVAVSIEHFFTPTDRTINNVGLTPDFVVPWDIENNPNSDPQLGEALYILRGVL